METQLEFNRWREAPGGLAYRRWVIISTGLRQMLRLRFFRILVFLAWTAGVLAAAAGLLFTQSVATGGWIESWAASFGPRAEAVASAFTAIVLLYPDICVRGLFTIIFWAHSFAGLGLSLLALTVLVPRLITRDRASHALTIYLSRPLRSSDYLIGKFGIIAGTLVILWTGPLLASWLLSMLVAPNTDFLTYSITPLLRALGFNVLSLLALASIALGVSALNRSSRNTILLWIGLWIVVGMLADFPAMPEWLRYASFSYDLRVLRQESFQLEEVLMEAAEVLPFVGAQVTDKLAEAGRNLGTNGPAGPFAGLAVLVALSSTIFFRRLRPE
ncbi:MAG TPA: ABC transporter permease subunit [Opitutaceae bacterium]